MMQAELPRIYAAGLKFGRPSGNQVLDEDLHRVFGEYGKICAIKTGRYVALWLRRKICILIFKDSREDARYAPSVNVVSNL